MTDGENDCPTCGEEYDKRIVLDSRSGTVFRVDEYDRLCTTRERRQGGPTMKKTRSESEPYTYYGYLHT